jgi:hypothetical protein
MRQFQTGFNCTVLTVGHMKLTGQNRLDWIGKWLKFLHSFADEIAPLYFKRNENGIPVEWIRECGGQLKPQKTFQPSGC